MAENHLRQHAKVAVNNTDHNAETNIGDEVYSASKAEAEQAHRMRMKHPSMDQNPARKKSCFVITRVIQKESTGEQSHEDQDSVDDLDETNTEEVSSEILDTSKQTDIDPDPSSEDTVQSTAEDTSLPHIGNHIEVSSQLLITQKSDSNVEHTSVDDKIDNIQSLSRFKVVKIESSQPFRRGRWSCQDFLNPPSSEHLPEKTEKTFEDAGSGNSSTASSVHYVPGVDDPGKNPLVDGFQSLATDAQQAKSNVHSPPSNNGPGGAAPPANAGFVDQGKKGEIAGNAAYGHGNGNKAQQPQAPAAGNASFNQAMGNVSQTHLSQNSTPATGKTEYIPNNTEYIPSQANAKQQPQQQQTAPATKPSQNAAAPNTQQDFQTGQNPKQPSNPPQSDQTKADPADFKGKTTTPSQNVGDVGAPGDGKQVTGGVGAAEGAEAAGGQEQNQQGTRSRESSISAMKMGGQGLLTPPLLQMVNAMQPQGANDNESGASQVAIDNKIEQAMDLVKSHLMYAVREEVDVLKEQIQELRDKNAQLEFENNFFRQAANQETIDKLKASKFQPPPTSSA